MWIDLLIMVISNKQKYIYSEGSATTRLKWSVLVVNMVNKVNEFSRLISDRLSP